ncbi:MAG TPA: CYCXC family (seleno)protein [Terriglobales bacterium]|nr:CYCXC family (seleno)protein [Terriglobales bacterium]
MRTLTLILAAGLLACGAAAQAARVRKVQAAGEAPVIHEVGVPAHHNRLPRGPLPPTLPPSQFRDPRVQAAYAMAAKVRGVLYQQPCYCHCDQELGHHSLLDCFAGDHASICETCMMEGVYAYRETKAGKTPGQIRAAIERGEWKNVNLNDLLLAKKVY